MWLVSLARIMQGSGSYNLYVRQAGKPVRGGFDPLLYLVPICVLRLVHLHFLFVLYF